MPTPNEWFAVYRGQQLALEKIAADVRKLADGGGGGAGGGGDGTIPFLRHIADQIDALGLQLAESLGLAAEAIGDNVLALADGASSAAAFTAAALAGSENVTVEQRIPREDSVAGAIDRLAASITSDPAGDAAAEDANLKLARLLAPFLVPGSKTAAEEWADGTRSWANFWRELSKLVGTSGAPATVVAALEKLVSPIIQNGAAIASSLVAPLQVPFREILQAGITDLLKSLADASKAHPNDPTQVALAGILSAHRLGQAAHGLAAAVEMHPLFHQLGFSHMAAAVVDLSGFAPMSQAALRPHIEAAIARPLRWHTNAVYAPNIPSENALADHVRRRTLNLTDYDRWLSFHGYDEEHRDRYIETVWRDPTIRDLALALEDAKIDEGWLLRRVRTAGYDNEDADQITRGLLQRANKASRERLRASASGAYAEGTISGDEYETLLADVGLSADAVRWERRAAELQRRRDAVKDALATYRRQYTSDQITRDDYELALDVLGVDPERRAAIVADADSTRAPRVQREEEAKLTAALSELRRELVPRYRALFFSGALSADEYQRTLEEAGIAPAVAAQAASLDAARIRSAAAETGSAVAERQLAALLRDRQELAVQQYRRGLLTDDQLAAALLAAQRPADQVDVVVERERLLRLPILARPPAIPAEAADRLTPEFRRRAAVLDFRAGLLSVGELVAALVATGRTQAQAEAQADFELARLPLPGT